MNAVQYAAKYVGTREAGGKNRGLIIDRINRFVGNPDGSPYCAAFIAWVFAQTGEKKFPITGSSQELRRWGFKHGYYNVDPQFLLNWRGAMGGWTNDGDAGHGHVFLIEKRYTNWFGLGKKVVAVGTIEANTNAEGSRDGDGIYRRKRKVPMDGGHSLWFVRVDGFEAGKWWDQG